MTSSIDKSRAIDYHLVSMEPVGGGTPQYFTDWNTDVLHTDGNTYVSMPDMEIEVPKNDGLFSGEEAIVTLELDDDTTSFTYRFSSPEPWPEVDVFIVHVVDDVEGGLPRTVSTLFMGQCNVVRRNPDGQSGVIEVRAVTLKELMNRARMGLQATHHCGNRFGDERCQIDLGANTVSVTITNIDVGEVTVTGVPGGKDDRHYQKGKLTYQGLTIRVLDWRSADPTKLIMTEQPPLSWLGQVVSLTAGCDKTIETCRSRWNNENQSNPLGFSMPPYNPLTEGSPANV